MKISIEIEPKNVVRFHFPGEHPHERISFFIKKTKAQNFRKITLLANRLQLLIDHNEYLEKELEEIKKPKPSLFERLFHISTKKEAKSVDN